MAFSLGVYPIFRQTQILFEQIKWSNQWSDLNNSCGLTVQLQQCLTLVQEIRRKSLPEESMVNQWLIMVNDG